MSKAKKISIIVSIAICVALVAVVVGILLIGRQNSSFDISNSVIANFSEYDSLSAGYFGDSGKSSENVNLSSNGQKNLKVKLFGRKSNGEFEEVEFDKNGKRIKQDYYLKQYISIGRYVFMTFTNNNNFVFNSFLNGNAQDFSLENYEGVNTYILDSETGKIYPTDGLSKYFYCINFNLDYGQIACFNDILYVTNSKFIETGEYISYVYKLSIDNGLKVEELIDDNKLNFIPRYLMSDRYENLYLKDDYASSTYKYLITKTNRLVTLEDYKYRKTLNGIVYTSDLTKKINADGELVDSSDKVEPLFTEMTLIKTENNVDTYFDGRDIVIVTWENDINFTIVRHTLDLENYSSYVATNNKIYFINENNIFYLDINTFEVKNLISDYRFYSISADNKGNVYFEAIDDNLREVYGIIKDDGSISLDVSNDGLVVLVVTPIN